MAGILGGLVIGIAARAAVPGGSGSPSPYYRIPERNVFNLRPPAREVPSNPPPVLPKITLTGITTLGGLKRAVLQAQAPARQGETAKEESHILAEGQREGDIEVLQIDEAAGLVKIQTGGTPLTLDFVNNGVKPATLPAPQPGAVPASEQTALPAAAPANSPAAGPGLRSTPRRPVPGEMQPPPLPQ